MRHILNGLHCITVLDNQVFFKDVSSAEQCCSTAVQSTERCTSVPHGLVFIPDKNYPDWGLLSGKRQRELQLKIKNCNLRPVLSFWWLRRSRHTAEIKASYQLFNPMVCGVFTVGRSKHGTTGLALTAFRSAETRSIHLQQEQLLWSSGKPFKDVQNQMISIMNKNMPHTIIIIAQNSGSGIWTCPPLFIQPAFIWAKIYLNQ